MGSRLTQLAARYIGVALVAIAGYFAGGEVGDEATQTITDIATQLAVGGGVFFALLFDLLIHRTNTGGIMKTGGK